MFKFFITASLKERANRRFKEYKNLGKGRLVLEVVRDHAKNNPDISFDDLAKVFPPELRPVYGVFAKVNQIKEKHHVRYFMKDKDTIALLDSKVAVCNQWGISNIDPFLETCKKLQLEIK